MGEWDRRSWESPGAAQDAERTGPDADEQLAQTRVNVARHRRSVARKAEREAAGGVAIPAGGGAALDGNVRRKMEGHLGGDLSDVRVHTGGESAHAATGLGARAFTDGRDIHFNAGQYAPGSKEGDRLLAHELTHVVQGQKSGIQRKGDDEKKDAEGGEAGEMEVSKPEDAAEVEADKVGDDVAEKEHGGEEKKDDKEKDGKEKAAKGEGEEGEEGEKDEKGEKKEDEKADAEKADAEKADGGGDDKPDEKKGEEKGEAKPDDTKAEEKPAQISAKYAGVGRMIFRAGDDDKKGEEKKPDKVAPQEMNEANAREALTKAFGGIKAMDKGTAFILDQAEFQVEYDKVYGSGQYSWAKYVAPGNLEGFRVGEKIYINKGAKSTNLGTVVHEMLHANASPDWKDTVGSSINEGTTSILELDACAQSGIETHNSYPNETGIVQEFGNAGLGFDVFKAAYFGGGAKAKICDWADANTKGKWAGIKAALDAGDFDKAKNALAKK